MDQSLLTSNTKKLWDTMKSVTNMSPAKKQITTLDEQNKSNELNDFYLRFDLENFPHECDRVMQPLPETNTISWLEVDPLSVQRLFSTVRTDKTTGPDGLPAFLLKSCAEELTSAWCPVFQRWLDTHTVPALWKRSIITPVPKKSCATVNNDFRPVALTSLIVKCFEKFVASLLKPEVQPTLDACQFAYKNKSSTEDAILCMLHFISKQETKAYV